MRDASGILQVFNSKATAGAGNIILCEGYRHLTAFIDFAASPTGMSINCAGSIGKGGTDGTENDAPVFTSAQSKTNSWDYIEMIDLQSGADIDGDVGIEATANDHRIVNVNTDGLKWVTFRIVNRAAGVGNASVFIKMFRD